MRQQAVRWACCSVRFTSHSLLKKTWKGDKAVWLLCLRETAFFEVVARRCVIESLPFHHGARRWADDPYFRHDYPAVSPPATTEGDPMPAMKSGWKASKRLIALKQ